MNTYKSGLWSEWYARIFLRMCGYKILASRYVTGRNTGRAEIDIIAKHKDVIVFVEVKKRKNLSMAWAAITPKQQIRLRRAAENYLIKKRWTGGARFDVIAVCGFKIYWAKNAF